MNLHSRSGMAGPPFKGLDPHLHLCAYTRCLSMYVIIYICIHYHLCMSTYISTYIIIHHVFFGPYTLQTHSNITSSPHPHGTRVAARRSARQRTGRRARRPCRRPRRAVTWRGSAMAAGNAVICSKPLLVDDHNWLVVGPPLGKI